jgi:hypothetical protein
MFACSKRCAELSSNGARNTMSEQDGEKEADGGGNEAARCSAQSQTLTERSIADSESESEDNDERPPLIASSMVVKVHRDFSLSIMTKVYAKNDTVL